MTSGLGVGGAETMLFRLVQSLHGCEGHEHAIVTLTDGCGFDFFSLGVSVDIVDLKKITNPLSTIGQLWRTIRRHEPDVIQGWMYHGNLAATLAAPNGIPIVWGIHHSLHDLENEKFTTRALIKAGANLGNWAKVRRIVYVSEKSQAQHCAIGYPTEKAIVIPNGFDCVEFSPDKGVRISIRSELGFDDHHLLIGNFGRYHPVKDHDLLLRAFATIAGDFPEARLLLAGTGITEANLELVELIRMLGIPDRVELLGPRSDMSRMYNALDLYVLSSKSESFPNVLGEASACGIPSITTDVGDAARIVGGTGCVVPPSCIDGLRGALRQMLSLGANERRSIGAHSRRNIVDHFGLPVAVRAYSEQYENLLHLGGKSLFRSRAER
ncbi:MAG: glycosyltransferase [Burkholderiales bacterium]